MSRRAPLFAAQQILSEESSFAEKQLGSWRLYFASTNLHPLMVGKLARKVTAIEHYEKFLILWRDADPG